MTLHYHLNGLVFFVGLVPLASLWLLAFLKTVLRISWPRLDVRYVALGLAVVVPGGLLIDQKLQSVNAQARQFAGLAGNSSAGVVRGTLDRLDVQKIPSTQTGVEIPRGLRLESTRIQAVGWAFSKVAVASVELRVKGATVQRVVPDGVRADVKNVFPDATLRSGYVVSALIPSDVRPEDVEVWVIDQYGNRLELTRRG